MSRFAEKYKNEVAPALMAKFGYSSVMQIPKFNKIVINVGCGDAKDNSKVIDKQYTYTSVDVQLKQLKCHQQGLSQLAQLQSCRVHHLAPKLTHHQYCGIDRLDN